MGNETANEADAGTSGHSSSSVERRRSATTTIADAGRSTVATFFAATFTCISRYTTG